MRIRTAVIPAAGLGTRFLPATKAQPKEMLPIVDKPTIQYIVEEAVASGIENIVIITGRSKRAIEDHFDKSVELEGALSDKGKDDLLEELENISNLANIIYIRQKEPLGLGHAVLTARPIVGDEPFAVMLGDDVVAGEKPALRQLMDAYASSGSTVLGVQRVPLRETSKYGIIRPGVSDGPMYKVEGLVEKPRPEDAPSNLAIMGRYVIAPGIMDILADTKRGSGGEIQLTDALDAMRRVENVYALEFEGRRYDVGDRLGFLQATCEFALNRDDLREPFREYLLELSRSLEGE